MNPTEWRTYLVTQSSRSAGRDTEAIVEAAIDGGVDAVQLREKGRSAHDRYDLGRRLRELTAAASVPLLVNDRIDLAAAIDADGVHLGQSDLPIEVAREQLGSDAIVGCSASTVAEAEAAQAAGADYLGVGAVYGTVSKDVPEQKDGIGAESVAAIADAVDIPVFGIGGITANNARPVIEAGATGTAVISAITAADDPAAATAALGEVIADAR
ncbi:thiamine phosphate synthase [Halorubrum sp. BV1]|uniref:thiamine phosphate synthase n=1 Tax=Halorubrum sp. BV1 TaxID=1498500 RepID=UPI000679338A|nr:thiamine phosphate synthase [Halorubrum sp. BV1]